LSGPHSFGLTRRALISSLAATGLGGSLAAPAAASVPRLAVVDWAMLETALALGAPPVAASELTLFRATAIEPAVPSGVADLGLRGSISYEQLLASRPDLVLISPWYENRAHILSRVAPVASFSIYEPGRPPYDLAVAATRTLGARIGLQEAAETAIARAEAELAAARAALSRFAGRPVLIMNLADSRHFRVFGADSMFGDVLSRLGLASAWEQPTQFGAYPTVGVEALAGMTEAIVVNVGPTPRSALRDMQASPLWRAMPPIAAGRLVALDPVNPYGALPAARRFATLLAKGLAALADA
jgi:iron complex transport system substrate-binding protein